MIQTQTLMKEMLNVKLHQLITAKIYAKNLICLVIGKIIWIDITSKHHKYLTTFCLSISATLNILYKKCKV